MHSAAYQNGKEPVSPIDNLLKPLTQKLVTVYLEKAKKPSQGPSNGLIKFGDIDRDHCDETVNGIIPLDTFPTNDQRYTFNLTRLVFI